MGVGWDWDWYLLFHTQKFDIRGRGTFCYTRSSWEFLTVHNQLLMTAFYICLSLFVCCCLLGLYGISHLLPFPFLSFQVAADSPVELTAFGEDDGGGGLPFYGAAGHTSVGAGKNSSDDVELGGGDAEEGANSGGDGDAEEEAGSEGGDAEDGTDSEEGEQGAKVGGKPERMDAEFLRRAKGSATVRGWDGKKRIRVGRGGLRP